MPGRISLYYIKGDELYLGVSPITWEIKQKKMNGALMASRAGSPSAGHHLTLDPPSASEHLAPDPPSTDNHLALPLRRLPPRVTLHKSLKKMVREVVHGTWR
jgi:hypothetical protein